MKKFFVYAKTDTDVSVFEDIINKFSYDEINFIIENRRVFRDFDDLIKSLKSGDVLIINDLIDIGLNNAVILNHLDFIINANIILLINVYKSTYKFDVNLELNKAVLLALKQCILTYDTNIIVSKTSVGRSRVNFPNNWSDLYELWINHEITSKEFIIRSGLKKATFYNLLAEYKRIQDINFDYIRKYRLA